ncbi:unnamed protein product [Gordionus sp. m RMFG-2023]
MIKILETKYIGIYNIDRLKNLTTNSISIHWFKEIFHPIMYLQGLLGNVFVLLLFYIYRAKVKYKGQLKPKIKPGFLQYFVKCLTVCDIILCTLGIIRWRLWLKNVDNPKTIYPKWITAYTLNRYILPTYTYFQKVSLRFNTFSVLAIALERYLLITNPVKHLYWCNSQRLSRISIMFVLFFLAAATVPNWVITSDFSKMFITWYNPDDKHYYHMAIYSPRYLYFSNRLYTFYELVIEIICSLIPLVIIIVVKIKLLVNLSKLFYDPQRYSNIKMSLNERKTTCYMCLICLFYLIGLVPGEFEYMISLINGPYIWVKTHKSQTYIELMQTLYYTSNFYIFLSANRHFTKKIRSVLSLKDFNIFTKSKATPSRSIFYIAKDNIIVI